MAESSITTPTPPQNASLSWCLVLVSIVSPILWMWIRGTWNFGAAISSHDMRGHEKHRAASWQTTMRRGGGSGYRFDPFLMSATKKIGGNCWIRVGGSCSLLFDGEVAGWVEGGCDVAEEERAEGERRVSRRRMPPSRENLGKGKHARILLAGIFLLSGQTLVLACGPGT